MVRLAGPEGGTDRVYALPAGDVPELPGAGSLWASERLSLLAASDESDRDSLIAFARRHSVAGPEISFLVLELVEDYVRSEIEPPAGFAQEKRQEYDRLIAEKRANDQRLQAARFDTVLAAWEKQKTWWARPFDPNARPKRPVADRRRNNAPPAEVVSAPVPEPNHDRGELRRAPGVEGLVLSLDVVLDLLAHELLAGAGEHAREAGLVALHVDVVPARSPFRTEVDARSRQVGGGREARVQLRVLADHDAAHGLVVDLDRLGTCLRSAEDGQHEAQGDAASAHGDSPVKVRRIRGDPRGTHGDPHVLEGRQKDYGAPGALSNGGGTHRLLTKLKATRSPAKPLSRKVIALAVIDSTSPAMTRRLPAATASEPLRSMRQEPARPSASTTVASIRFSPPRRRALPNVRPRRWGRSRRRR